METIICNFFAGPGTGKSTMMAGVFAELKWRNINCEMVTEYAKDKVWEESLHVLHCQPYIFGKQLFRLFRLKSKVDIVITDSPILLSPIYDKEKSEAFLTHVIEQFNIYRNYNVFLKRIKPYNPAGRYQGLDEAIEKDKEVLHLLQETKTPFVTLGASRESVAIIADALEEMLKENTE